MFLTVRLCPREGPTSRLRARRFWARSVHPRTYRQMVGILEVVTATQVLGISDLRAAPAVSN